MGVLVRNGRHMRPMLAVLTRNRIGSLDKYYRGRWIEKSDLPSILNAIRNDRSALRCGAAEDDWCCNGTNIHNAAYYYDFVKLFET